MSIKRKLAIAFSIIVSTILILNNVLFYYQMRERLINDQKKQMETTANELAIAIQHSQYGSDYVENLLAEELRIAALAAEHALSPDIHQVTNQQLEELSKQLGVSDITLFAKKGDDIVAMKSSDPKELNLSTKSWGYWFTAMQQLLAHQTVTVKEGQTLPDYWSGPIDVATSDPSTVDKWGYYDDGLTNYIIDPYLRDNHIVQFNQATGPQAILEKTLKNRSNIVEITGFNPNAFGKAPIVSVTSGVPLVSLGNRPIFFGQYNYKDAQDVASVQQAIKTRQEVDYETYINGKNVLKSFIPVSGRTPYVLGMVTDCQAIQDELNAQLRENVFISLLLLILVFVVSDRLAGFAIKPLRTIVHKVTEMAEGRLGVGVEVQRNDEVGLLATRINEMSKNLQVYTEELRSIIEHNPAAIISLDLDGICLRVNPAAEKMIGYSQDEICGTRFTERVAESDVAKLQHHLSKVIEGEWQNFLISFNRKDGSLIELGMKNVPIIVNEELVGVYCIARDITESKKTAEILRKSDKLALVGRLAAGVAHEIRNPLTAIKGFIQFMQTSTKPKQEYFAIMMSELDRIELIVNEFLVLAKPQVVHYQPKNLTVLLRHIVTLVDTQAIMSNVQIHLLIEGAENLPLIECEENQLKQVFINILRNSIEAMPDGGNIYVSLQQTDDQNVLIRFVDEGYGIPQERIKKLGEPFYTTKEKGTGLGLMVSYKIISEHQGQIHVSSELNVGTTVDVVLPIRMGKSL